MSMYITVKDSKMVGRFNGPVACPPAGVQIMIVPDAWPHYARGRDVRELDEALNLRPLAERIADGLVVVSAAEKVDGEHVVAKTALERIRDGIDAPPVGQKLVGHEDSGLALESMTLSERVAAGLLTREVAFSLELAECEVQRKAAYADEADPLYMMAVRGEINSANGLPYSLEDWKAKIAEIKRRFPKPAL